MANEFVIKNGYFSQGDSNVTGSLQVTGSVGVTGSVSITQDITASKALLSSSGTNQLMVIGSGSSSWITGIYGSQGNLLTITDTFSGSIFTVTDISGYPILDITSDYYTGSVYLPTLQSQSQQYIITYDSQSGLLSYATISDLGGSVAPLDTYIQYNNNNSFGASQHFRYIYSADGFQHGFGTSAQGAYSHAEGYQTITIGQSSHAEGFQASASGNYSHAEGLGSKALGNYSHAEGANTQALNSYDHAEGSSTIAQGTASHAEGNSTVATGLSSHAEGSFTYASGISSHAEGFNTSASGDYQLVIGQYNVANTSQSAFIIGDGTANNNRHNLLFASKSWFEVSASNVYLKAIPVSSELNVLVYNSSSGQVYYTASSAIGGGGGSGTGFPFSGSAVITGSLLVSQSGVTVTGSISSTGGFTGSLLGTASYVTGSIFTSANPALSASFASTASFWSGYLSTSSIIGNGLSSSFNINHGFNTRNLHITVYESSSNGETVYPDIRRINANTASIIFANPPSASQYIVYISQ